MAQPLRRERPDLIEQYSGLLASASVDVVPFDLAAAWQYGSIRASTPLRQPDAMQLACAVVGRAATFITNDQRLWGIVVPGIDAIRGL